VCKCFPNKAYIQDIVEKGKINIEFISSIEMVAYLITKGLPLDKFREHAATM
jgi:hypothetical protein